MHDEKMPMPTQRTDGRARCFCGEEITNASVEMHIHELHRGIGRQFVIMCTLEPASLRRHINIGGSTNPAV
jgi:hypothetical protein